MTYLFLFCLTIIPAVVGATLYRQRSPECRDCLDFSSDTLSGVFVGLCVYIVVAFIGYGFQTLQRLFQS